MSDSAKRRVRSIGWGPAIGCRIILSPRVQGDCLIGSTPDDHFLARPFRRLIPSTLGRSQRAGGDPTIRGWIVPAATVKPRTVISSTPNDHLAAGPYCRVGITGDRRVGKASSHPAISDRIISPAGVRRANELDVASPDNHLGTCPHQRVT